MSRRMISPQMLIKSQVVDDKFSVDLNEILEKYGTTLEDGTKVITLQIYNKEAYDEPTNNLKIDSGSMVERVVANGSITISKYEGDVYIQGMLFDLNGVFIPYLEISSGSYENGIILSNECEFDLYVIRV